MRGYQLLEAELAVEAAKEQLHLPKIEPELNPYFQTLNYLKPETWDG